jgi:hypothetical protein
MNNLRTWFLKKLIPELFSGVPQPQENKDLASESVIERALFNVQPQTITAKLDGDRCLLQFSQGAQIWLDINGIESLANIIVDITRHIKHDGMQLQTIGERAEDAIDIHGYSFLVRTSQGLCRFDKQLPGAFINPGQDVACATVQFTITPEGEILCDEGWSRAL